jgi:hypothetical protein
VSTTNDPNVSDAERAAHWSIIATEEGRYELAEALLRIAIQASRKLPAAPARPAPDVPRPPALTVVMQGPTGNGNADLAREAAAIGHAAPVRENRRCEARVINGNFEAECNGGVAWEPTSYRWYHVDPELDQDHYAAVREG